MPRFDTILWVQPVTFWVSICLALTLMFVYQKKAIQSGYAFVYVSLPMLRYSRRASCHNRPGSGDPAARLMLRAGTIRWHVTHQPCVSSLLASCAAGILQFHKSHVDTHSHGREKVKLEERRCWSALGGRVCEPEPDIPP